MVFAEVGAGVSPVHVSLSMAMFTVASLSALALAVKMMSAPAPLTVKNVSISLWVASSARAFNATVLASSKASTYT